MKLEITQTKIDMLKYVLYKKYVELETKRNNLLLFRQISIDPFKLEPHEISIREIESQIQDINDLMGDINIFISKTEGFN